MDIFQSGFVTEECSNAPLTMYYLNSTNAQLYNVWAEEITGFGNCGNDPLPDAKGFGCCSSSLDLSVSGGYRSLSFNQVDNSQDLANSIPNSANNRNYCHIVSGNSTNTGFYEGYFLDTNSCLDGFILCTTSEIKIFPQSPCNGSYETFPLTFFGQNVYSNTLGNITISIDTVLSGTVAFTWTTYYPGSMMVPVNKCPMEILQLITIILGILGWVYVIAIRLYKFSKERKFINVFLPIGQAILLTKTIMYTYEIYSIIDNPQAVINLEIANTLLFLGHLILSLTTANIVNEMLFLGKIGRIVMYVAVTIVHFSLAGFQYLFAIVYLFNVDPTFLFGLIKWESTEIWLIFFEMIFDCIPPGLLLYKVFIFSQNKTFVKGGQQKFDSFQKKLKILFSVQFLVVALYLIIQFTSSYTRIYRTDRNAWATFGLVQFLITVHSWVIFNYFEELKMITKEVFMNKSSYVPKAILDENRTAVSKGKSHSKLLGESQRELKSK